MLGHSCVDQTLFLEYFLGTLKLAGLLTNPLGKQITDRPTDWTTSRLTNGRPPIPPTIEPAIWLANWSAGQQTNQLSNQHQVL